MGAASSDTRKPSSGAEWKDHRQQVLQRLDLRGVDHIVTTPRPGQGPSANSVLLPRPEIAGEAPRSAVREIIERVRVDGDAALFEYTSKFDGVSLDHLRVEPQVLEAAVDALSPELRAAMETAIERIELFHRHQLREPSVVDSGGVVIEAYQKPVSRAGLYVPGGRAEYPSTVLMTAVPARVAGVRSIALCVPPNRSNSGVAPSVLAAAHLAGVTEVFAVGGAQAIAAMAYGTDSIAPVDVIAGPGNIYVALAKQEVAGDVGVAAAFAGPSEVVVVADKTANPEFAAIDVIVQAEHGPDGLAWLVTWDEAVADAVCAAGDRILSSAERADDVRATLAEGGYVALVDNPQQAIQVVDAIAPEHLELQCENAEELARSVENAGAIFCGHHSPASLGDYVAGPSHVLPTFGSARFSSALTVTDFVKDHHIVTASSEGLAQLGPHVIALADQEGLAAHAQSIRLRQASDQ